MSLGRIMRLNLALLVMLSSISVSAPQTPAPQTIDQFFTDFTAEWVRGNPNAATGARYFTGEEQDRLERQLTPQTEAYIRERIALARKGLAQLRKFDRTRMSDTQRGLCRFDGMAARHGNA